MANPSTYQGNGRLGRCITMPATNAAEVDPTARRRRTYCAVCVGSRKYAPVARTPTARYMCHACNGLLNITLVPAQNECVQYRTPSLLAPLWVARLPPLKRGPWLYAPASQRVCLFQDSHHYTHSM